MEATRPKAVSLVSGGRGEVHVGPSKHPCEYCKCCACKKICTMCSTNCSPADSFFIPVVGCPEFADMCTTDPVRYLYRNEYGCEYRLHLPRAR